MYDEYIRNRIDELRIQKDISEYQLSFDIGRSSGYIQSISSGRNKPSMKAFLDLCEYFDITPAEFFDPNIHSPGLYHDIMNIIKAMPEKDALLLRENLNRYKELYQDKHKNSCS